MHTNTYAQIGDLYSTDPNNLQLALEYWAPASDHTQHGGLSYRYVASRESSEKLPRLY